jgi:hypothetical protein
MPFLAARVVAAGRLSLRLLPLVGLGVIALNCGDSSTTTPIPNPPSIVVASSSVVQQGVAAGPAQSTTVGITNGGDGTLAGLSTEVAFTAGEPTGWLTASLDATTAPTTLRLEGTPPPRPGTYRATVNLRSTSIGAPQTLAVAVELVVAARPLLYVIEQRDNTLRRLDPETLTFETVGPIGADFQFGACAWDPVAERLYATDGRGNNQLLTLDLSTGAATAVGTHGIVDLFSLAYHPPSQQFYAASRAVPRPVYRVSGLTAVATEVGSALRGVDGLAWDTQRNMMLAVSANSGPAGGFLTTMDLQTGATTMFGSMPSINSLGVTYDPGRDLFWVVDVDGRIITLDPADNFAAMSRGTLQGQNSCVAYVP